MGAALFAAPFAGVAVMVVVWWLACLGMDADTTDDPYQNPDNWGN